MMDILTTLRDRTRQAVRHTSIRRHARRGAVACGVVAGHALLIFLLCAHAPAPPVPDTGADGTVILASLVAGVPETFSPPALQASAKPAAKRPPSTPLHAPEPASPSPDATSDLPDAQETPVVADPNEPQLSDAETQALEQFQMASAAGAPDQPCNLTGTLSNVFAQSPEVRLGLNELPVSQRSVANAVMLWDGQWPEESLSGGKALLRALLVKAISAARPDCLTQANTGPVLFFVPDDSATVIVAVGSGDWRWGDLLSPAPAAQPVLLQAGNYFQALTSGIQATP